ncbi:hypothetical protein F4859DRAFT_154266 [Xylaria cf. heliscus]|nr:hypothetical protein F4859DRAFT_154266 [Xylaria cf. heliscus]
MPSMQSTVILATALLGSLLQHAAAAPEASSKRADVQFPDCISTCMRNSGCFDTKCVCKKAADGILSDIVICMNQWCPSDITANDLIEPLDGQCSLPQSAVQDAQKKGGVLDNTDEEETSSAKPTATPTSSAKGSKDDEDEITMTYDLGAPVTAAAETTTTAKPAVSGTLTVPTGAATTGLLTDGGNESATTVTGSLGAATSTRAAASSSPSTTAGNSTSSTGDEGNAAGLSSQSSVFGVIAAMAVALALGF